MGAWFATGLGTARTGTKDWRKEEEHPMRIDATLTIAGAIAGFLTIVVPAWTQNAAPGTRISSEGAPSTDLPKADYQAFDEFSADHPELVAQLGRHPHLLEDEAFLARHKALREFLASHQGVKDEIARDPGNFLPLVKGHGAEAEGAPAEGD
jgi:hypothetical protein